jgi:hypothetical protein
LVLLHPAKTARKSNAFIHLTHFKREMYKFKQLFWLQIVLEGGHSVQKNYIEILQNYCSKFDEKMGYFKVKDGNKVKNNSNP